MATFLKMANHSFETSLEMEPRSKLNVGAEDTDTLKKKKCLYRTNVLIHSWQWWFSCQLVNEPDGLTPLVLTLQESKVNHTKATFLNTSASKPLYSFDSVLQLQFTTKNVSIIVHRLWI